MRIIFVFLVGFFCLFSDVRAQESSPPPVTYSVGEVLEIVEENKLPFEESIYYVQQLRVKNTETNEEILITVGSEMQPLNESQRYQKGQKVVLADQGQETSVIDRDTRSTVITDMYRLPILFWILLGFFVLVFLVSGVQGLLSIGGMVISLLVLSGYIVPSILAGSNPMLVSLFGATLIAGLTVYLSHGFKVQSHIALGSMLITLLLVTILSSLVVGVGHLTGLGTEEAAFLQLGETARINLSGLLLGGILLGALGVLDDITVSQVSVVFELKRANKKLSFADLYQRGMSVGRDHVASLVNTLMLAYAGANLPLFILFTISENTPLWVLFNSEFIAEEVVRTLVGSMGLVMAVPIATLVAAYRAEKMKDLPEPAGHHH